LNSVFGNSVNEARIGGSVDAATGKYRYSLASITQPGRNRYSRDDLRSRWQTQLGLRLRF